MPSKFASGKWSIASCDRCGFRYKLKQLKSLTIKTKNTNILVCPSCFELDQPQLQLGMYPVTDAMALRNPRPELGYYQSGPGGSTGSRIIYWGWNPVGYFDPFNLEPNTLVAVGAVGTVTVTTT